MLSLQVTVLWIGINNADAADAAAKLDALLAWMQGAMPRTRLLVLAPTPQAVFPGRSAALLAAYRPVLRARGVELSLCGQNINPANAAAYNDGLHLSAAAYRVVFSCLKPRLAQLRAQQLAKRVAG